MVWTFYPAFLATAVSIVSLTLNAKKWHDSSQPQTLSEMAALDQKRIKHFAVILTFCGLLFAVTLFGFVTPHAQMRAITFLVCLGIVGGELLAGLVPAKGNTLKIHNAVAFVMGVSMLVFPFLFCLQLPGRLVSAELALGVTMAVLAVLTITDKARYIYYELPFIYLSHLSILVAAIGLN